MLEETAIVAETDFPIFPDATGPKVLRIGNSKPRTYWQKYWIQLCLTVAGWLGRQAKRDMRRRFKEQDVEYTK